MTFIFDIDGTLVRFHTSEWLPGAKEKLERLHALGHTVVLITQRGAPVPGENDNGWNIKATEELLAQLTFKPVRIYGSVGPRVLVDDNSPHVLHTAHNSADWVKMLP